MPQFRNGLPRTVGAEESRHHPRPDREAEVIDGELGAEALGQSVCLDHEMLPYWLPTGNNGAPARNFCSPASVRIQLIAVLKRTVTVTRCRWRHTR